MNKIKNDLCDALTAFTPDLPTQYSTQVQSIVNKMTASIEFIFERSELKGFMKLYKINLDTLNAMMDEGKHKNGDE